MKNKPAWHDDAISRYAEVCNERRLVKEHLSKFMVPTALTLSAKDDHYWLYREYEGWEYGIELTADECIGMTENQWQAHLGTIAKMVRDDVAN